jgi:hypothetical protein
MRFSSTYVATLLLTAVFIAPSGGAKEGVRATILTPISPTAIEGSQIDVGWSLADEKSGKPFSACAVFIRLIGPNGESTEAFAKCALKDADGNYDATAVVPIGGISRIEIGIAGTMTDRDGNSERSDWLLPLTNDPMRD